MRQADLPDPAAAAPHRPRPKADDRPAAQEGLTETLEAAAGVGEAELEALIDRREFRP